MNITWAEHNTRPGVFYSRLGKFQSFVQEKLDGSLEYTVNIVNRGVREVIHRVTINPVGPFQIDAYARCEYLMKCYDRHMVPVPLDAECPVYNSAVYNPTLIPMLPDKPAAQFAGITIGGVYLHHESGKLYTVIVVSNGHVEDQDKWPTTVVYRDLASAEIYSRPVSEFTPKKYQHVPIGSVINPWKSFYVKHNTEE